MLYEQFQARKPDWPVELLWRSSDPVGFEIEHLENGRGRLWCREDSIEELRAKALTDPKGQMRADEILAAHDTYLREVERLRTGIGLDQANAIAAACGEQFQELFHKLISRRAVIIDGMRAKALALLRCF
jgi:hypothetical protein